MKRSPDESGCIDWPDALHDSPEGGMWVYAFWLAEYREVDRPLFPEQSLTSELLDGPLYATVDEDPYVKCTGPDATITLAKPNQVVSVNSLYPAERLQRYVPPGSSAKERERYLLSVYDAGAPVLAAICLGSTSRSLVYADGSRWECTLTDLTKAGTKIIKLLNQLYNREACLVTFLDI